MQETIIQYIKKEILNSHSNFELSGADDLLSSGLIDSIGMMKLISYIENQFELTIPPQDMTIENFITVDAITIYLQQQQVKSN